MLSRIIFAIPIVGWLLKEAAYGSGSTKALFLVNCFALWLLAISFFGYPAIILPALAMVPTMFVVMIVLNAGR